MSNEYSLDALTRLTCEMSFIETTINDYDESSHAAMLVPTLKEAVAERKKETILYCIDEILKWYQNNIQKIRKNEFVFNIEEHEKVMEILNEIRTEVNNTSEFEQKSSLIPQEAVKEKQKKPLIFLSHRSSDKKYGDALEKFIVGLGVKNDQLIYTSHPLHKIPLDKNIYEYLRQNIGRNIFMIILWSDEYLESPACMNEMGAAWVVQCDYTNIYVPSFSFGNPKYHECAVDTKKMGAVLNGDKHCRQSMIELKDKIESFFKLKNDEKTVLYLIDEFIEQIKGE